ncbi:hypothetical protein PPACK8108_LOCUS11733 [Phakopsora pachyrhizi]|uniref:Uncharacterized protein n=1 Tax=Phakopsora pachyrhizi TaxID=170000 RepID=A0AAV0B0M0_PHAPC|nr:hypothetical protein PPACK8108_LOCUS11733 [Phakopsora pachyrhizi]
MTHSDPEKSGPTMDPLPIPMGQTRHPSGVTRGEGVTETAMKAIRMLAIFSKHKYRLCPLQYTDYAGPGDQE